MINDLQVIDRLTTNARRDGTDLVLEILDGPTVLASELYTNAPANVTLDEISMLLRALLTDYIRGGSAVVSSDYPQANQVPKLRKALAEVRRQHTTVVNRRVGLLGDSTSVGSGASNSSGYNSNGRAKARAVKIAEALNKLFPFAVTSNGVIGGQNVAPSTYAAFDTRFTFDTNWVPSLSENYLGGTGWRAAAAGGTNSRMTFAPGVAWKTTTIYFLRTASQGTFSIDINGAAPTQLTVDGVLQAVGTQVVNAAGADGIGVAVVVQTGAAATHTLGITWVSGIVHMLGFLPYDSSTNNLDIVQVGASGADVAQYANGTLPYQALPMIDLLGFSHWFISLGINDWRLGAGSTDLALFAQRYAVIVDRCLAAGAGVTLVTPPPSEANVATIEFQKGYVDAIKKIATDRNLFVVDLWSRFQSYEVSNPLGFYTDTLHPSAFGYSDWAALEARVIFNS